MNQDAFKNENEALEKLYEKVCEVAADKNLATLRYQLAKFTGDTFCQTGEELHMIGSKTGASPHNEGNDEAIGIALLLRIAGQLTTASADLFKDGRPYAAAALLRQLVEVEYLAWAFETNDRDAERWLHSSRDEREAFFKPSKVRQASQGKFRGKDYGYHCELGGHPVPRAEILLRDDPTFSQLLLSDLLGHTMHIWVHLGDWAAKNRWAASPFAMRNEAMLHHYKQWQNVDHLVQLPPPP